MTSKNPHRTLLTTLLGVVTILAGGLGTLFSLFALLLAIGKPYASTPVDPLGIFIIFILPPVTLLAGICLLLRHRWARIWMIMLMVGLMATGLMGFLSPSPTFPMGDAEVIEAVHHTVVVQSSVMIGIGALVLLALFSRKVRAEFSNKIPLPISPPRFPTLPKNPTQEEPTGWRVGHRGRDMMYYEEYQNGSWLQLDIDGEMLTGRAHHVIYFANEATWSGYPEWARHRRAEIIGRIKSQFREPDYEYYESSQATSPSPRPAAPPQPPFKEKGSVVPSIAALLALAFGLFWMVAIGIDSGETKLPAKYSSHKVTRAEKPALFWTSIATISSIGLFCSGASVWLLWTSLRRRRG